MPKSFESEKICICTHRPPNAQTAAVTGSETLPAAAAHPLVTSSRHDKKRLVPEFFTFPPITPLIPEKKQTNPQQTSIEVEAEETLPTTASESVVFFGIFFPVSLGVSGRKRRKNPVISDDITNEIKRILPDSLDLSIAFPPH